MENINLISIGLEAVIVLLSLGIALGKKRAYGWGLALTFLVYVAYDLVRLMNWQVSQTAMTLTFLVASISATIAVYSIYKKA